MRKYVLTAGLLACAMFPADPAEAGDLVDITGLVGYGFDGDYQGANAYSLGLGARVDLGLFLGIFIGGNFMYYFGTERAEVGNDRVGLIQGGGEAGIALDFAQIGIRPYISAGILVGNGPDGAPTLDALVESSSAYVQPGLLVVYKAGPFFIGPEARYTIATADGFPSSFGLFGAVGLGI